MNTTRLLMAAGLLAAALHAETPALRLKTGGALEERDRGGAAARGRTREFRARERVVVQFREAPGAAERAWLEQRGARILAYVPEHAWIVNAPAGMDWSGLDVAVAGRLAARHKLSPLLAGGPGAALAEFHADVNPAEARALALQAGLTVLEHPDLAPSHLLVRGGAEALAALDEVQYVMPAAEELLNGMPVSACLGAEADGVRAAASLFPLFGEGWDGPGLNPAAVGFWFGTLTPRLPAAEARAEFLKAMAAWASVVQVTFEERAQAGRPAAIDILFTPLDGPYGALARTFYPPPNPEPVAGDMHFDIDELWRVGADIDLFSVALHELGHALGLGHSDDPRSVMYPYYRRVASLHETDKNAIRQLYASNYGEAGSPLPPGVPLPEPAPAKPAPQPPAPAPAGNAAPPTLALTYPAAGALITTAATVTIRGAAADAAGNVVVTWSSNTGASGAAQGAAPFSAGPIPLMKGLNQIRITATGAGGSTWRTVSVTRR